MGELTQYHAADLPALLDRINRHSIGMDEYFDRVFNSSTQNYPPYNVIQVNSNETRLEIALAGFKKEQVIAYTEYGKLFSQRGTRRCPTGRDVCLQGIGSAKL